MAYEEALASLRAMLDADGYALTVHEGPTGLVAEIRAGPDACADCLVQKELIGFTSSKRCDRWLAPSFQQSIFFTRQT